MPSSAESRSARPYLLVLVLLGLAAFLYFARQILIPAALAILLTFVLGPFVTRLERRGMRRVPAVLVVVTLVFLLLGGLGWVVSRQVTALAGRVDEYHGEIVRKLEGLKEVGSGGIIGKFRTTIQSISDQLSEKAPARRAEGEQPSRPGENPEHPLYVQTAPSDLSRLLEFAGPAGEGLLLFALLVVLVIFMLIHRENLRNRLVRLAGPRQVVLTTRMFDEAAQRISRYLLMLLVINLGFGLAITLGMVVTGLSTGQEPLYRYALLWGFLCGTLRFVPYLGTWIGAGLVLAFNIATLPGWALPLGVFGYFCLVEFLAANVAEPLLFGRSTGSSPVGLLLAMAFWAWLWGPVGLVLATPLTVILVVLGKYLPQLSFFAVLLGDEVSLRPEVNYYQRLVARDQDEASELAEEALQEDGSAEAVFDGLLLPALSLARRDVERGDLDAEGLRFLVEATREVVDDVAGAAEPREEKAPRALVLGCPARDEVDELTLDMLARQLGPLGYEVQVLSAKMLTAEVLAKVGSLCPAVVCVSSVAPGGLAQARYLCKRLHAQCPEVKIVVGRWGEAEGLERVQKRLQAAGASHVATTLAEAQALLVPLLQLAAVRDARSPALSHSS
jgi:predicted PurR-regulated permease PerM